MNDTDEEKLKEEIYQDTKRNLISQYYEGNITKEEYETKQRELDDKKRGYDETSNDDGLFSSRSIYSDMTPEQTEFWAPLVGIGGGIVFIIAFFVCYYYWPVIGSVFERSAGASAIWILFFSLVPLGIFMIILGIGWFRKGRK